MPTTTNFGWTTPADTDLVKDGAAAIRTLGSSIDTSLVDLKGGTTGQILSKASNTDLDYTWITNDVGDITEVTVSSPLTGGGASGSVNVAIQDGTTAQKGAVQLEDSTSSTSTTKAATPNSVKTAYDLADAAIPESIVNAKGDLISASADNTPAILTAGSNGETLVADSSTTTGLRWQGAEAAGKNAVINGGMDFWQRGTSSSSQGYVVADRFYCSGATTTYSQETSDIPTGFRYAIKLAATGTTQPVLLYAFETQDVLRFADKSVTLSYYVKSSNSTDCLVRLDTSTSVDNSVTGTWTTISSNAKTTTTSWARVSHTFSVGSTVKSLRIVIGSNVNLTSGQSILITGVQLELGSVATPFTKAGGTLAGELAACQRYYTRFNAGGASSFFGSGNARLTTIAGIEFPFQVRMRITPATLDYSGINVADKSSGFTPSAVSLIAATSTPDIVEVEFTCTGLTQFRMYFSQASAATSYIGFSAEL